LRHGEVIETSTLLWTMLRWLPGGSQAVSMLIMSYFVTAVPGLCLGVFSVTCDPSHPDGRAVRHH